MAHLIDYVAWRGDLPMSDYPLVISDILTLSQLTYCSFPADRCPVSVHDWLLTQEDTLEVKGLTDEASSLAFAHACACSRHLILNPGCSLLPVLMFFRKARVSLPIAAQIRRSRDGKRIS